MSIVVSLEGNVVLLNWLVDGLEAESTFLRLFQNDITVDRNTTLGQLTEADYPGYSAVLDPEFRVAVSVNDRGSVKSNVLYEFAHSGGDLDTNIIYGYYVTTATKLLWSENLEEPFLMEIGASFHLRLKLTLRSEN